MDDKQVFINFALTHSKKSPDRCRDFRNFDNNNFEKPGAKKVAGLQTLLKSILDCMQIVFEIVKKRFFKRVVAKIIN